MSSDRDLPPLPLLAPLQDPLNHPHEPLARQSIANSLPSSSLISRTTSESRTRSTRTGSRRDSKDSVGYDEITRTFKKLQTQVLDEKRRADDAERRLAEVTSHLKTINDARLAAMQDAARAKEELNLYKVQLETAQREIYRAQDVIAIVDRQRYNAEKEAAKNRSKTRQLNETIMIQAAREEAWRMGLQEGLDRGRDIALAEPASAAFEPTNNVIDQGDEYSFDETRSATPELNQQPPFPTRPRSIAASQRSKAPTMRTNGQASPNPVPVSLPPILPTAPPSAPPSLAPRSAPPSIHPSDQIRPISMRGPSPTPRMSHGFVPPDNLIPSLDADNRIRIPPPYEFSRTPDRVASPQLPTDSSQEALPIPPRSEASTQRRRYHRRNSSSDSSALSALDIVNEPFGGTLRTPMSVIREVNSQHSGSPLPPSGDGDHSMRHQRSMSENSVQQPSYYTQPYNQRASETQSQYRPQSRTSIAGSWVQQPSQHHSSVSNISSPPDIQVQPPSRPISHKTDSLRAASTRAGGSPSSHYRAPLSVVGEAYDPPYASSSSHMMPGGLANMPEPSEAPTSSHRRRSSQANGYSYDRDSYNDDDAVSSAMSGDTLTTPPDRYRNVAPDWSGAVASASQIPIPPIDGRPGPGPGSMNTATWSVPPEPPTVSTTSTGGGGRKMKKGGRR